MGGRSGPILLFLALGSTLLAPAVFDAAAAQGSDDAPPRPECCPLLLVPVGARASALGGSNTALPGSGAAFRNPAGLAAIEGGRFVIHHLDNVSINTQVEAFTLLLSPLGVTLGLSYQLFDKGDHPTIDPSGIPTGELALRDHLLVASLGVPLPGGLAGGISYRYFQERIDCTGQCGGEESTSATGAVDIGMLYSPSWEPALAVGIALVNMGPGIVVEDRPESNPLPSRIHLGLAYDLLDRLDMEYDIAFRVALDVRDRLLDLGSTKLVVGLELDVQQAVFLRAGYVPGQGLGTGAAVGLELRYDRFDVAVSRSFVNSQLGADTDPFQVSFGLNL